MSSRIVVVGSLNADFVINVEKFPTLGQTVTGRSFQIFPGGKGANQAYAAAKLGGRVSMVGQVGNDAHANCLRDNLISVGVDVSHVERDSQISSGIASILIDQNGGNQIVVVPGANGKLTPDRLQRSRDLIASARVVLLQLEIPIETVEATARIAKDAGAIVILDPAPARELSDAVLKCVDYTTPNETELTELAGLSNCELTKSKASELAHLLRVRGANKIIVKMGARGAMLVGDGLEHFWPAMSVKAVDTTAAGDAFNAAFAVALAEGKSEIEAGQFATIAAACSVTRPGAQTSMPTRTEVEDFAARQK